MPRNLPAGTGDDPPASMFCRLAEDFLRVAAGLTCIFAEFSRAHGQSVDYGGFEQLLGEPVTTPAPGRPRRMSEVPANTEIITADDIGRSGADNIPDILEFIAGFDVRRHGFAAVDVGVGGYNETSNPRLLVLLNGQQVTGFLQDFGVLAREQ